MTTAQPPIDPAVPSVERSDEPAAHCAPNESLTGKMPGTVSSKFADSRPTCAGGALGSSLVWRCSALLSRRAVSGYAAMWIAFHKRHCQYARVTSLVQSMSEV